MTAVHIDKAFELELRQLRERVLAMGAKVERQVADSFQALVDRDSERAEAVREADQEVNCLEVEVDELCRRILALRQPAASDLRCITTSLKIVTDLERMGDLAVNIASRALELNQSPPLKLYVDAPRLAQLARQQVREALDAFVRADAEKAEAVLAADAHLDTTFHKVFNELLAYMMEDPRAIRRCYALMSIARHLERIGDHATNVAEMVVYMVRGTDIRHRKSRRPRA